MYDSSKIYVFTGVVLAREPGREPLPDLLRAAQRRADQVIRDDEGRAGASGRSRWKARRRPRATASRSNSFPRGTVFSVGSASAAQRPARGWARQERPLQVPGRHGAGSRQALRFGAGRDVARPRRAAARGRNTHVRNDELKRQTREDGPGARSRAALPKSPTASSHEKAMCAPAAFKSRHTRCSGSES